ncbi:hypothetical protein ACIRBY_16495 [Streptomyces sp. NPDC096136]|uniref:hypothetical protein n=1 Tax=Streptomyces sp. NPDC096136 TaxID=3366076 RepID=UPI003830224B
MVDFLQEHSTTLLALLTVVAAFAGTWLGSHIQAKGGLAQAKAAKEAAETAAAATLQAVREQTDRAAAAAHAAAVRDRRTAAIADLLRTTREFTRALDRLYTDPNADPVDPFYNDFFHARGAVELCAPTALLPAMKQVVESAQHLANLARARAEAELARNHLSYLESTMPGYMGIRPAVEALAAFREACRAGADDTAERYTEASRALFQVSGLTLDEQGALMHDCVREELGPVLERRKQAHSEAMDAFIDQSRAILGVND